MHSIVASDIFGRTTALDNLCKHIGGTVEIVDPYGGESMGFTREKDAYDYFTSRAGISDYSETLRSALNRALSPVTLVGFSVGASAIWKISGLLDRETTKRAVCFYGSQIRHYLDIEPSVKLDLILPSHETSFCIAGLAKQLSNKKNLVLHNTPYLHGFMNTLSNNYCDDGYQTYVNWLRTDARQYGVS